MNHIKKILKFTPKCNICHIKNVRLYRPYGKWYNVVNNRCNVHVSLEDQGWYVPLIINNEHGGLPWGYTSVPEYAIQAFYKLPEACSKCDSWAKHPNILI